MYRHLQATKFLLFISTFILATVATYAQQLIPIKGTIRETGTQKPVPGVSVKAKNANIGTSTDENGQFSLTVPSNDILLITAIGHAAVEQPVNGKQFIDITIAAANIALGEVVVVGYGAQSKRSLVSAVATIKADEIKNKPVASFDQQLQGRVAGVQVSANTGIPGDGIFFRIRGTTSINAGNDPLYVVDGVFINNQSLQKITTPGTGQQSIG
jgi:hypothetical protein